MTKAPRPAFLFAQATKPSSAYSADLDGRQILPNEITVDEFVLLLRWVYLFFRFSIFVSPD
jgi:hypothetical protein